MSSKLDYLKRYMSKEEVATGHTGDDFTTDVKKRKHKKSHKSKKIKRATLQIIDASEAALRRHNSTDYDGEIRCQDDDDEDHDELLDTLEYKPQIAAIVDERERANRFASTFSEAAVSPDVADEDNSWQHSRRKRHDSSGSSDGEGPAPSRSRDDSDSDLEVVRKSDARSIPYSGHRKSDSISPESNVRRERNSPHKRHHPGRRRKEADVDSDSDLEVTRRCPRSESSDSAVPKMADGGSSGLLSLAQVQKERKASRWQSLQGGDQNESMMGRNAETVVRGRLKDRLKQEKQSKEAIDDKTKAKFEAIGRGLKQNESDRRRRQTEFAVSQEALARTKEQVDESTRFDTQAQHEAEDPMFAYLQKRKKQKEIQSGSEKPVYPTYSGPPAPANRFGIAPGYRWDGVPRSNGFEGRLFAESNKRKAQSEEAHKWSIEDM